MRKSGASPDEAWDVVRGLLADLGDEDVKDFATPRNVKEYLGTPRERNAPTVKAALLAMLFLGFAGYISYQHVPWLVLEMRSFFWPETEATILEARAYKIEIGVEPRRMTLDVMDFTFRFEVDGREYVERRTEVPYTELFGDKPFEVGDRLMVEYNPRNPDQNVHERFLYRRAVRLAFAAALFLFAALAIWYVVSRIRMFKRLSEIDASITNSA